MTRTRFAPSPTGFVHVGSLRTALYNFLYAKKNKGKFIIRIEDTDQTRLVEGSVENLIKTLKWAGLFYDEGPQVPGKFGPYIQSERLEIYKKYAEELLEKGSAYKCFCTTERLEQMRKDQESKKMPPRYDRKCLTLSKEEIKTLSDADSPFVVRLKIPESRMGDEGVSWTDSVRGNVEFKYETIDDQVLMKSDGFPTYHLANVVDDHLMEITHVIRGEEWLSSTPKHIILYNAFGWRAPSFAHLPLLLNKDRTKLSKRQGHVSVEDFIQEGYLPEAMINFIALLGWHPGGDETQEIFSLDELVEKFSLEKVHKGGAVFDLEKLDWINWQWRRKKFEAMPGEKGDNLISICARHLPEEWQQDKDFLKRCLVTVEEKAIKNPEKTAEFISFYFAQPEIKEELLFKEKMKVDRKIAQASLSKVRQSLESFDRFDDQEEIKKCLVSVVSELGVKNGQVLWPTRVALTGEEFSPGVFEVIWALGKEKTLERLDSLLKNL